MCHRTTAAEPATSPERDEPRLVRRDRVLCGRRLSTVSLSAVEPGRHRLERDAAGSAAPARTRSSSDWRRAKTRFSGYAGMDVGCDNGLPVDRSYAAKSPYRFTGTVKKVVFDLKPGSHDDEKALHEAGAQRRYGPGDQRLEVDYMCD